MSEEDEDEQSDEIEENGSFSIRIMDDKDNSLSNIRVTCAYGLMAGTRTDYTDEDGWATFPVLRYILPPNNPISVTNVSVSGESVGDEFTPDDGETYSFTIASPL